MKIIDILQQEQMSLSFEVFPPKKETGFESVRAATEEIAALRPSFMSVTYGAGGGGASVYTLDIAENIKEKYDVPMLAHLTCVAASKASVAERIQAMKDRGIHNVMALRGDITPEMEAKGRDHWDYAHAVDLIRELKEDGSFCIGAACYPEVHPESTNQKEDIKHLKEKVDAGADFLTTQMFFDNNLFYNFLYKIREAGILCPVIPGIMPITNPNQITRAIQLSGAFMPQRYKAMVDRFGHDPYAMKQAAIAYATDQIIDLYANGITNVHLYTMNKPEISAEIQNNLIGILRKKF